MSTGLEEGTQSTVKGVKGKAYKIVGRLRVIRVAGPEQAAADEAYAERDAARKEAAADAARTRCGRPARRSTPFRAERSSRLPSGTGRVGLLRVA
jgi:hypothetical protein